MRRLFTAFAFLAVAAVAQAPTPTRVEVRIVTTDPSRGIEIKREVESAMRAAQLVLESGTIKTEYRLGQDPPTLTDVTVWRDF